MKQTVAGWGIQFIIYWVYTQSLKLIFWHFIKGLGLCLFRGGGPVKKHPVCINLKLKMKVNALITSGLSWREIISYVMCPKKMSSKGSHHVKNKKLIICGHCLQGGGSDQLHKFWGDLVPSSTKHFPIVRMEEKKIYQVIFGNPNIKLSHTIYLEYILRPFLITRIHARSTHTFGSSH